MPILRVNIKGENSYPKEDIKGGSLYRGCLKMECEALASCCTTLKGRTTKFTGERLSKRRKANGKSKLNNLFYLEGNEDTLNF